MWPRGVPYVCIVDVKPRFYYENFSSNQHQFFVKITLNGTIMNTTIERRNLIHRCIYCGILLNRLLS